MKTKNTTLTFFLLAVLIVTKLSSQCTAGFNSLSSGPNGQMYFFNTSTPTVAATFTWNLGNSVTSTVQSPYTTYTANGVYTVSLVMSSSAPSCTAAATQTILVNSVTGCSLNANFSVNHGANGQVNFTNHTTGADPGVTYSWSFGDGNTSNSANPVHTYSANGAYVITLNANNNFSTSCISAKTMSIYVSSYCNGLTASFTHSYGVNGKVHLSNTSTGTTPATWFNWDFGGPASMAPLTYFNGTYTITLTASNMSVAPTCTSSATQTIQVSSYTCNLNASFSYSNITGPNFVPGYAGLWSTSSGTNGLTMYQWDFGDGSPVFNSDAAVTHTYTSGGTYYPKLKIYDSSNPACADSITAPINISSTVCLADANFTMVPSNTPQYWYAIPSAPWIVTAATWNWGDGASSNSLYSSHTYSAAGTYSICLSVTVSCGSSATSCSSNFIYKSSQGSSGSEMVGVSVIPPGSVGLPDIERVDFGFSVYPNPARGKFNLDAKGLQKNTIVRLYNSLGEEVYETSIRTENGSLQKEIDANGLAQGIYFLKMESGAEGHTTRIILIK